MWGVGGRLVDGGDDGRRRLRGTEERQRDRGRREGQEEKDGTLPYPSLGRWISLEAFVGGPGEDGDPGVGEGAEDTVLGRAEFVRGMAFDLDGGHVTVGVEGDEVGPAAFGDGEAVGFQPAGAGFLRLVLEAAAGAGWAHGRGGRA